MAIPGSNLLRQALSTISPSTILYYKWIRRDQNINRQYVDFYETPFEIKASVQAVNRARYMYLGLDFQKDYVKIWTSKELISLDRDYSGDVFVWNQKQYKLVDDTDWSVQDGWASALAVRVRLNLMIEP